MNAPHLHGSSTGEQSVDSLRGPRADASTPLRIVPWKNCLQDVGAMPPCAGDTAQPKLKPIPVPNAEDRNKGKGKDEGPKPATRTRTTKPMRKAGKRKGKKARADEPQTEGMSGLQPAAGEPIAGSSAQQSQSVKTPTSTADAIRRGDKADEVHVAFFPGAATAAMDAARRGELVGVPMSPAHAEQALQSLLGKDSLKSLYEYHEEQKAAMAIERQYSLWDAFAGYYGLEEESYY
ncbi:hypothetical protein BV20DRAFT_1054701 [Pilatotrama ljubarskyi]|nr:hypothetical protein BV20DRAFT_1054701 [Pilatotrama ljubarskyi]